MKFITIFVVLLISLLAESRMLLNDNEDLREFLNNVNKETLK